jgi:mono/diheme cytochrome c family protein
MKNSTQEVSKKKMPGIVLIAITILMVAFVPMQQPWTAPPAACKVLNPVVSDAKSLEAGKIIYTKNCYNCHGKKGKGDGPKSGDLDKSPKDFTKELFQSQTDGSMFWKMTEGRKPMPSFKKDLTPEQRWQVINYVRTLAINK